MLGAGLRELRAHHQVPAAIGKHPELAVQAVRKVIDAAASYLAVVRSDAGEGNTGGEDHRRRA